MIRLKTPLVTLVLLFSLIACSQGPITRPAATATFTPYVGGTQTALASGLASPTPWFAGTETAMAVASSSPTPPPLPTLDRSATATLPAFAAGTFTPVFYGSSSLLLLGGFSQDQGWVSAENVFAYANYEAEYDFFSPRGSLKLRGSALELSPTCRHYFMRSPVALPEPMVGVASGWVTGKRETKDLSTTDPTYIQAVTEWFQSKDLPPSEIHITRILQADLEGDRVDEVLLSATYFRDASGHLTETGDYSVVLMRKVAGNDVVTVPLISEYYVSGDPEFSYPRTYTLAEAIDLSQDGILEVVVDISRWEGGGAIVFGVDGQHAREVLRAFC